MLPSSPDLLQPNPVVPFLPSSFSIAPITDQFSEGWFFLVLVYFLPKALTPPVALRGFIFS